MHKESLKNKKGFTLVELAIVLVIIGLLLAAILKGQDLMRSAKIKKYYNQFIKGWEIVYYQYQDRTGRILGDTNGDGYPDATTPAAMDTICSDTLPKVGLTPPQTNTDYCYIENMAGKYYDASVYIYIRRLNVNGNPHNVLYLTYVPTDIAIALDTIVDGKMDANSGNFQQYGASGDDWPDPQTTNYVNCAYILD